MDIYSSFANRFEKTREEEFSLEEYLALCKNDPSAYAAAGERMLAAIGEPEQIDTRNDPRLSRIFANKVIKVYPAFREFYGMEEVIEQVVAYFRHAAQGLEEKKQILYLLGPVGGGKSSIAERLKQLMERVPFYALKGSPVNESPLGLFDYDEDGPILEEQYGIPRRYLKSILSPWAVKRLHEYNGDIRRFRVVRRFPSILRQIGIAKTEPGDENNQDISSLVGKVDIRKLEQYAQDDADACRECSRRRRRRDRDRGRSPRARPLPRARPALPGRSRMRRRRSRGARRHRRRARRAPRRAGTSCAGRTRRASRRCCGRCTRTRPR